MFRQGIRFCSQKSSFGRILSSNRLSQWWSCGSRGFSSWRDWLNFAKTVDPKQASRVVVDTAKAKAHQTKQFVKQNLQEWEEAEKAFEQYVFVLFVWLFGFAFWSLFSLHVDR
jgi:hypothetical protein